MSIASVITVRPSRIACVLLFVMVGLAFCSLLVLISWQNKATYLWMALWLVALVGLLFLVTQIWKRQVGGSLTITGAGELMYVVIDPQCKAEKTMRLMRIENRVVWNMLVAFRAFDDDGRAWQFLILFDSVSEDAFRRLKIFLRW